MSWNVFGKVLTKIRETDFAKYKRNTIVNQTSGITRKQVNDLMRFHAERYRKIECKGGFLQAMELLNLSPQM